ncbi:hypothetical protein LCGC14_2972290, partial [marine sediment metagenome]
LWACATRNIVDLLDKDGTLASPENLRDLPREVTASIETLKQTKRTYHREDGSEVVEMREVINEVKPVPKAVCMDMAMKHKGAYAAEVTEHKLAFDFDQLYFPPEKGDVIDVEGREK